MSASSGPELRAAVADAAVYSLSPRYLEEFCVLPLGRAEDGTMAVAVARPLPPDVRAELEDVFNAPISEVLTGEADIRAAILAATRDAEGVSPDAADDVELLDDAALASEATAAPIVSLVNVLLLDALRADASDVHFEPAPDGLRVRYRVDGVLRDVSTLTRSHRAPVISRVKLMANLDIAERRLPQDGRARVRLGERETDVRIATLPSLHGESVVVRILDEGGGARSLGALGMPGAMQSAIERVLRARSGVILVTGPTGSGKTTTLYGALRHLNDPGVKIVTVEDPVEYRLEGAVQLPINRRAGLDFAAALRAMLRQDPDIMMVGELRDRETADIAVQAALTGHLVLSTLHTIDSVSAVVRLGEMGVEPYLVGATVRAVVAQRLVRLLCRACARDGRPVGCSACQGAGYRARTGLFELFVLRDHHRQLIVERAPLASLRAAAAADGMVTLEQQGRLLVESGQTTLEEILRVTDPELVPDA